uniref:Serine aminopeptidase S33 domain-containing protein n=1 Tax=Meloidogyne enterolobii TaxID=390850 RepID=A0A6V7V3Q0_MELEN|nr:unnamed protein product [Meloidogyne enterolobii]
MGGKVAAEFSLQDAERNHGESPHTSECSYQLMAADLREFIQKEVLSRSRFKTVFLLGHSMGGKVAAEFSLQDAEVLFF